MSKDISKYDYYGFNPKYVISLDKCKCSFELFPIKECKERFHVWYNIKPDFGKELNGYALWVNALIICSDDLVKQWNDLEDLPANWKIKALGLVKGTY